MPPSINRKNMFFVEPYRSIIAILNEFPDRGLTLKEIQYVIIEKHYLRYISIETHALLDEKVEKLIKSTLLIKYKIKTTKRKRKKPTTSKYSKADTIRSNLLQFLKNLIHPRANAIISEERKTMKTKKTYYKLRKEVYNDLFRQRNIDALASYPSELMYNVPFETGPGNDTQRIVSWILYGFSENMYKKLQKDDKEKLSYCLYSIEALLERIEKIQYNSWLNEWNRRINRYVENIKSRTVKTAFIEKGDALLILVRDALFYNRPYLDYQINEKKNYERFWYDEMKKVSKVVFFRAMGWIFPVPGYEKNLDFPIFENAFKSKELSIFYNEYYNVNKDVREKSISSMPKTEIKKYLATWSKEAFSKDYNFTKKDLLEILEWCWKSREVVYDFLPYPFSFSRYYDDDKAFDNWRESIQPSLFKYKSENINKRG